jgi:hypothetical protein
MTGMAAPDLAPSEGAPFIPLFTVSEGKFDISTQTPVTFFTDFRYSASDQSPHPSPLSGSGSSLFSQYQSNIQHYFERVDPSSLSDYRAEVFNRVRQQSVFQSKVFGHAAPDYNTLPPNTFSTFAVSLYLVIFTDHFVFSTASAGFEVVGNLGDELVSLLGYFDQQLLPPQLLEQLKKLSVVWYDGGLICEINDQRRQCEMPLRIHLRIHPDDVLAGGFELEQEWLFARFPLLCLEPSLQVGKVARVAAREKGKWKPSPHASESPAAFMQMEYPALFIEEPEPRKPRVRKPSSATDEELREQLMKKFGLA